MQNKLLHYSLIIFISFLCSDSLRAQLNGDECITAFNLSDVTEYCSMTGQYSNNFARQSANASPNCWPQGTGSHDVWFSFAPTATAAFIQLKGLTSENVGTLQNPSMVIYEGRCNNLTELTCASVAIGENIAELTVAQLVIGQLYYIRVDGRSGNVGDFQICIDVFNPVPSPQSDCGSSVILCNKEPFFIPSLIGTGNSDDNLAGTCITQEFASSWYTWTCETAGTLTFTLTPNNPNSQTEDIDFAVFELPNGISDCRDKILLRCMASGENQGCDFSAWQPCTGATGLRDNSIDIREDPGCYTQATCSATSGRGEPPQFDDNFLAPVDMEVGKSYALIVNNFSASGFGFSIEFGGTGTFRGPQPDFLIEAQQLFECDKTIMFQDLSLSETDQIVEWNWNFGAGATPLFSDISGPHDVIYDSFGEKLIALTIESSKGCRVTKILDIYIEPCCQDTSTLAVIAEGQSLICAGESNGSILAKGISGSPDYNFSIDGGNTFSPSPVFSGLIAGSYEIFIQDEKGCTAMTEVTLDEPLPLTVDAGRDTTIDLGQSVQLNASYSPSDSPVLIEWLNPEGLDCVDCLDPFAKAPGSTIYTIRIQDPFGCTAEDEVTIFVSSNRPLYAPNVFSPNGDGNEDYFKLYAGLAGETIEDLTIFDRWGSMVYEGQNISLESDYTIGWDGKFRGKLVENGVYSWIANVRFIDGAVLQFTGDVTVIK